MAYRLSRGISEAEGIKEENLLIYNQFFTKDERADGVNWAKTFS